MIQKRSRIKINTDLAKIRQAGKNPQEVQQIADELKECGLAKFVHDFYVYDVDGKILLRENRNNEYI